MTQDEFLNAVRAQLDLLGVPHDRAALEAFVASVWPHAEDDPEPVKWARAFAEAGQTEVK
jgi:ferredoxin-NADP reductase